MRPIKKRKKTVMKHSGLDEQFLKELGLLLLNYNEGFMRYDYLMASLKSHRIHIIDKSRDKKYPR